LSSGEKLVIASCGGGRSGYRLMRAVLEACQGLAHRPLHLEAFCGPFMDAEDFRELEALRAPGRGVHRFTPQLIDYLSAADLSISLAGYNTCMNLLATGVPALVLPYSRQREQPWRAQKLMGCLPMIVLSEDDLESERIAAFIETGLALQRLAGSVTVNLDGAATTARLLAGL
jgi:predicted glycosyltransferase